MFVRGMPGRNWPLEQLRYDNQYAVVRKKHGIAEISFGFVVYCPEYNPGICRTTLATVKSRFPGADLVFSFPEDIDPRDLLEASRLGQVVSGGRSVTALINRGIEAAKHEWNFILACGGRVTPYLVNKFLYFLRDERDVLFSVVDRKIYFDEASLNGMLLHRRALQEIGHFPEDVDNLREAKTYWATKGLELGYKFKAVVGAKFV